MKRLRGEMRFVPIASKDKSHFRIIHKGLETCPEIQAQLHRSETLLRHAYPSTDR
jgi:hypothetical protein